MNQPQPNPPSRPGPREADELLRELKAQQFGALLELALHSFPFFSALFAWIGVRRKRRQLLAALQAEIVLPDAEFSEKENGSAERTASPGERSEAPANGVVRVLADVGERSDPEASA